MTTHEVLVAARNLIDREGWVQRDMGGPGRGYCALGAIKTAAVGDVHGLLTKETLAAWCHALPPVMDGDPLMFNNAEGRTKAEVLAAFDKAIAATAPAPDLSFEVRETKAVFA